MDYTFISPFRIEQGRKGLAAFSLLLLELSEDSQCVQSLLLLNGPDFQLTRIYKSPASLLCVNGSVGVKGGSTRVGGDLYVLVSWKHRNIRAVKEKNGDCV